MKIWVFFCYESNYVGFDYFAPVARKGIIKSRRILKTARQNRVLNK